MYPEELYQVKGFPVPRELLRPIAFNLARGLIQDELEFPTMRRTIEIDGYQSHYITCRGFSWWVIVDDHVLHSIMMSDETSIKKLGFLYSYPMFGVHH